MCPICNDYFSSSGLLKIQSRDRITLVKMLCASVVFFFCFCFCFWFWFWFFLSFPGGSEVKASAFNVGDSGSIPESGRFPGEGKGNPLQYSCLKDPMDREA